MRTSRPWIGLAIATSLLGALRCATPTGPGADASHTLSARLAAGDAQTGAAGSMLDSTLVVSVTDASGRPAAGVTVLFVVAPSAGQVESPVVTTNSNGVASTRWTVGTTVAVTHVVTARVVGTRADTLTVGQFSAKVVPGPGQLSAVSGSGQSGVPLAPLSAPLTVRVADVYGNPIADQSVTWTLGTGAGTLSVPTSLTNAQGIASVTWTLGTTLGPLQVQASAGTLGNVSFSATCISAGGTPDITVAISLPAANDSVPSDSAIVRAQVTSKFALTRVVAQAGTRTATLSFNSSLNQFTGTLSLVGVPYGAMSLSVTATDVNGISAVKQVAVTHAPPPPKVTVTSPVSGSVASPDISLQASCVDVNGANCTRLTAKIGSTALATGITSLNSVISLAAYAGSTVRLTVTGTNSAGMSDSVSRSITVTTLLGADLLTEVPGTVLDISGNRVLYANADSGASLYIRTLNGGPDVRIFQSATGTFGQYSRLTPGGAVFVLRLSSLYEYRQGSGVRLLDAGLWSEYLAVNDRFVVWSTNDASMTRRDVSTGTNTVIATNAGNTEFGVSPNGDVSYWTVGTYQVMFAPVGATPILVSTTTGPQNTYATTDGTNVLYRSHSAGAFGPFTINWWTAANGTVSLTAPRSSSVSSLRDYVANAGWLAWTDLGLAGEKQVWIRSATVSPVRVTNFGSSSVIEALAPTGDAVVTLTGTNRRYLVGPTRSTPVDLGQALGTTIYRDGHFVLMLNGAVFTFR
jgi:hypothetical protein